MCTAEDLAETLKILANPIRLKILALCMEEKSSRELREMLNISKPLLINHIKKLINLGFLEVRVEIDEERMTIKKIYKTKNFKVVIDKATLEKIRLKMN